jgi:hypothetical protein
VPTLACDLHDNLTMSAAKPIVNYYKYTKKNKAHNPNYKSHLIDIPFRMLVVAASGGGKTNFLCELIHRFSGTFEEIIICVRTKHEPLYELLEKKGGGQIKFFENKVPDIEDFKDKLARLVVFDDLILSKALNERIGEYYVRSRKYNMSCAYLSQSYYMVPKLIRMNCNYLVLKKLGTNKDIAYILREYALDLTKDEMMALYQQCTADAQKLGFLMIDLQNPDTRFRANFEPISV